MLWALGAMECLILTLRVPGQGQSPQGKVKVPFLVFKQPLALADEGTGIHRAAAKNQDGHIRRRLTYRQEVTKA